jgi:hypothetical protein
MAAADRAPERIFCAWWIGIKIPAVPPGHRRAISLFTTRQVVFRMSPQLWVPEPGPAPRGGPGGPEPGGVPPPQRRIRSSVVEQARQAFTIYFDGRIPTP